MEHQGASADELFAALRQGSEFTVRQLLLRNPQLANSRDEMGVSALLHSLYSWDLAMLEILLAAFPALDIFEAAAMGRVERLQQLLECTPELARAWAADGVTALHLACFYGQEQAAECLLDAGADPAARAHNDQGNTPLQEAACGGHLDIVLLLLARGAEADIPDHQGWTALHQAASRGYQDIVEALLRWGNTSYSTVQGPSPRDLAVANGHMGTARVLDCLAKT